jgi:hypothetical protein
MKIENYYEEKRKDKGKDKEFPIKIVAIIAVIVLMILALLFLLPTEQQSKINITTPDENNLTFSGSLISNGELVDTFGNEGRAIVNAHNSNDKKRVILNTGGMISGGKARAVIKNSGGQIVANLSAEDFVISEDGQIEFFVGPKELGVDEDLFNENFFEEGDYEFTFEIIVETEEGDVLTIKVPYTAQFQEFSGTGCILLNRSFISDSTHFGFLEEALTLRIKCNSNKDLEAKINWESERMGNVEILFSDGSGSLVTPDYLALKKAPTPGDYEATINYTPLKEARGEIARFSIDFKLDNSEEKLSFNIANENLEQCLQVKTIDNEVLDESDIAQISIDSSNCASDKINIFLCDNDGGCSGGAEEGTISLSTNSFKLNKSNPRKVINISKNDLPGIYGVTVHASLPGTSKTFITEKEIIVHSENNTFSLDKYTVSMLGKGARDSIKVSHKELAEDIEIETNICNLYKSSLGLDSTNSNTLTGMFTNSEEWVNDLYYNQERYAGTGYYQQMFHSTLPYIDSVRQTAFSVSQQNNALIKRAYEGKENIVENIQKLNEDYSSLIADLEDLEKELDGLNENEEAQLTSQISGLLGSVTALAAQYEITHTKISFSLSTILALNEAASSCGPAKALTAKAAQSMALAEGESSSILVEMVTLVNLVNDLYSIYETIDAMSNESQTIDADNALNSSEDTEEYLLEAKEKIDALDEALDEALASASINKLKTADKEDDEAKDYLVIALNETEDAIDSVEEATASHLEVTDSLTTLQEEAPTDEEMALEIAQLALEISTMIGLLETKSTMIESELASANISLDSAALAAAGECGATIGIKSDCCALAPTYTSAISSVTSAQTAVSSNLATIASLLSNLNTIIQAWEMYESLQADYFSVLNDVYQQLDTPTDTLYDLELLLSQLEQDLENAIVAAEALSRMEEGSSKASTYLEDFGIDSEFGEFDKERMIGLTGTLVSNGFVNGAYAGGVYTTQSTSNNFNTTISAKEEKEQIELKEESRSKTKLEKENNLREEKKEDFLRFDDLLKEDCANNVELTLPDYKINLLQDASPPELSATGVSSFWNFTNAKVNGFFEEQEASIIFQNSGQKENTYSTLTIKATKHIHDEKTKTDDEFGPFNVPDKEVEEVIEKFHLKINSQPRKDYSSETSTICQNGLMFGKTGEEALPKTLMNWEWKNITKEKIEGKYLDATQFSVLLAKKLSSLNNFLSTINPSCPENYSFTALKEMTPQEFFLEEYPECFIPMTTRIYDKKPGLYYFMDNKKSEYKDDFFEESKTNRKLLEEMLEFEVPLIKDGYGLEFQNDFASYYTNFATSSPAFTDPSEGTFNLFFTPKYFFFTSETQNFESKYDFILPDAGLYKVNLIVDFDALPLIQSGQIKGKARVEMYLEKAISENYSPFYYTPFDGKVGLGSDNDRRYYGVSLDKGDNLKINNLSEPNVLSGQQKDSIVKIDYFERENIFSQNSFDSRRGKIFDFKFNDNSSIIFSPTTATPILIPIIAEKGEDAFVSYAVQKREREISSNKNNLLLITAIDGCKDNQGNKLDYVSKIPDFKISNNYAFGFPAGDSTKMFFKTIVYAPVQDNYSLIFDSSVDTISESPEIVPLEGIKGMSYNDLSKQERINSIDTLFEAVKEEGVCVSRLGDREMYWWPEDYLYKQENLGGKSLQDKINSAKAQCK